MTFLQEIGVVEAVLGDVASFAAGNPVNTSQSIAGHTINVEVVHLPNGPAAPYQTFTGSFWAILLLVLADAQAIATGQAVAIAEKVGNSWYGVTFSLSV